jgi:hypothetical protein
MREIAFSKFIGIAFSRGTSFINSLNVSISKTAVFGILSDSIFAIVDLPELIEPLIKMIM